MIGGPRLPPGRVRDGGDVSVQTKNLVRFYVRLSCLVRRRRIQGAQTRVMLVGLSRTGEWW